MATNTNEVEYLITSCPNHGSTVVGNFESFVQYVGDAFHFGTSIPEGCDTAWVCCSECVVDPYGLLDY